MWGVRKNMIGCFLDDLRAFGINAWTTAAAQRERECLKIAEQGPEHFMAKWIVAEKARAGLRHAIVCLNVTGRTKERIAQSKRTRAGSLALVDWSQVARLQMPWRLSLVLPLFCFASFSSLCFR